MNTNKIEHRIFPLAQLEVRAAADDQPTMMVGYAAVFDQLSDDLGGFREKIKRGAFSAHIGADVRALWNHDPNYVLGRTKSKTLHLQEDSSGLKVEIEPPDAQWARDLMAVMERGDVDQMSFGFRTLSDTWEERDGEHIRTLNEVELFDVSPVTFPAYPQTEIALRSLEAWKETTRNVGAATSKDGGGEATLESGADVSIKRKRLSIRDKEEIIHGQN